MLPLLHVRRRRQPPPREHHGLGTGGIHRACGAKWYFAPQREESKYHFDPHPGEVGYFLLRLWPAAPSGIPDEIRGEPASGTSTHTDLSGFLGDLGGGEEARRFACEV